MDKDDSAAPLDGLKTAVEVIGTVIKIAGDQPDVKSAGANLAKSAKTITQFINVGLLPIAAINFGYDKARMYFEQRFASDVHAAASHIPDESLQEPSPAVIGPAVQGLAFAHEEEALRKMYLNLIASAMDNRGSARAHPAFAEIIRQLGGFEAGILRNILISQLLPIVEIQFRAYDEAMSSGKFKMPRSYRTVQTHVLPLYNDVGGIRTPFISEDLPAMVDNWVRLGLVRVDYQDSFSDDTRYDWVKARPEYLRWVPQDNPPASSLDFAKGRLLSTAFGHQFATAVGAANEA
jgi:hypothetical protein